MGYCSNDCGTHTHHHRPSHTDRRYLYRANAKEEQDNQAEGCRTEVILMHNNLLHTHC